MGGAVRLDGCRQEVRARAEPQFQRTFRGKIAGSLDGRYVAREPSGWGARQRKLVEDHPYGDQASNRRGFHRLRLGRRVGPPGSRGRSDRPGSRRSGRAGSERGQDRGASRQGDEAEGSEASGREAILATPPDQGCGRRLDMDSEPQLGREPCRARRGILTFQYTTSARTLSVNRRLNKNPGACPGVFVFWPSSSVLRDDRPRPTEQIGDPE